MKTLSHYVILLALLLACGSLLGALASGLGVRAAFWEFRTGFSILRWSAYAGGAAAILAAAGILLAKFYGGSLLDARGSAALLLGLAVIGVPWWTVHEFGKTPTVADATTNIGDPPSFVALVPVRMQSAQNPLAYRREEAADLQARYFPDLETLETDMTPAEVVTVGRQAVVDMGLEIAAAEPAEGRLEATATSFWFGFKDDLVLRARTRPNGTTLVDIRSASRVGKLDGGVNGKRVRRLMQDLRKNL
ncbi:MAG TPA: DUF1499 domain-containing protein [Gammaproteobacteria bacterium]|nr:DUF1499 domain-containing protein [Gammaproteobacteria bacterium]